MVVSIPQFAIIFLRLPDGRFVLQRRTNDASYGPGKIGLFGGWVEKGETSYECMLRELAEETSLEVAALDIEFVTEFSIPAGEDFARERHFSLYAADISDMDFTVYEGTRAEAYTLQELGERSDLIVSAYCALTRLLSNQTNQH